MSFLHYEVDADDGDVIEVTLDRQANARVLNSNNFAVFHSRSRHSYIDSLAKRSPQSLLILHLDADRLRNDGLHLGDVAQFSGEFSRIALGASVTIEETTSNHHLCEKLATLALEKKRFDVIVVIAHSNAQGIRIASDAFVSWGAFAGYLTPFQPRRLLLVACKAGRWNASNALFAAMPKLQRIFACPVNASRDFGALMLFAVLHVVAERRLKDRHVMWWQVASIVTTGRQLREWRRTTDAGNPDSAIFDQITDFAAPCARQVSSAFKSAVKKTFG